MSSRKPKYVERKAPFTRRRGKTSGALHDKCVIRHWNNGVETSYSPEVRYYPLCHGSVFDMIDTVTPGSRQIRKEGGIINTQMWQSESNYDYSTSTHAAQTATYRMEWTGASTRHWFGSFGADAAWTGYNTPFRSELRAISAAAVEAYSRVIPPETLIGVTALEGAKTAAMITQTARRFAKGLKTFKRAFFSLTTERNFTAKRWAQDICRDMGIRWDPNTWDAEFKRLMKRGLGEATSTWLALRYGWTPLLSDIVSTAAAFALPKKSGRLVARGREEDTAITVGSKQNIRIFYTNSGKYSYDYTCEITRVVRSYVIYQAESSKLDNLHQFGVLSPISTLWEYMPWSFVIDWFVRVGDWIEALEPKIGVKYLATGYTVDTLQQWQRIIGPYIQDGPNQYTDPGFSGLIDRNHVRYRYRSPYLSVPSLPPIDVRIDWRRALDAIALLKQVAGSKFSKVT